MKLMFNIIRCDGRAVLLDCIRLIWLSNVVGTRCIFDILDLINRILRVLNNTKK